MALSNTSESEATTMLTACLGRQVADVQIPSSSGMSAETILFSADGRRFVARTAPSGPGLFPAYDFERERTVMAALAQHTGVPVPAVEFHDDRLMVMPFVAGRVPSDDPPFTAAGWVLELSEDQRARLYDNALAAMAQVHGPSPEELDLGSLELGLPGELDKWRGVLDWAAAGDENPTLDRAYAWLQANQPADAGDPVVCWGDARPGNVIFDDDMAVAAVLDWEMATVAAREFDLAWWLFVMRYYTEGIGVPAPAGFPTREETISRYEQLTGAQVQNVDYYEVFAAFRLGALLVRAAHLMIGAGLLPPDATMALNNPVTQLLSKLLDLPSPDGEVQNFVGNR